MAGKKTQIYTHKAAQKTENRHHALMHNAETVAHSLPEVSVALSGCHIHIHNFPLTAEIKHISARFGMLLPTAVTLSWTPNSTMWIFLDHIIIYFNLNVFIVHTLSAFLSYVRTFVFHTNCTYTHTVRSFTDNFGVSIYFKLQVIFYGCFLMCIFNYFSLRLCGFFGIPFVVLFIGCCGVAQYEL